MYGIYSTWSHKFCFGIKEPSKIKARKKLFEKIGKDAYRWRFEVRKLPRNIHNVLKKSKEGLELKIQVDISAPELAKAINNLAVALTTGSVRVKNYIEDANTTPEEAAAKGIELEATFGSERAIAPQQIAPITPPVAPVTPVVQGVLPPTSAVPVQQEVPQAPQAPVSAPAPAPVPTTAPTYSTEQLAVAATQLVDAGRRIDLLNLLSTFGVQALTALPKEQYGAFATQLRVMGAKI